MTPQKLTCKEAVELATEYLERALLPEMEDRFNQHLDSCVECLLYLDQMRRVLRILPQLADETILEEEKAALLQLFHAIK